MTTPPSVRPWPEERDFYASESLGSIASAYQRASAEAALDRLRVAVEKLSTAPAVLRSAAKWAHGYELRVDLLRVANEYEEAISLIGPLPERM